MGDQFATCHQGYMKSQGGGLVRVWGVNDLAAALYQPAWPFYSQLHEASCDIRYGLGLRVPLDKLAHALKSLKADFDGSPLVAP